MPRWVRCPECNKTMGKDPNEDETWVCDICGMHAFMFMGQLYYNDWWGNEYDPDEHGDDIIDMSNYFEFE